MEVGIIPKQDLGKLETHHKEGLQNTNQYMTNYSFIYFPLFKRYNTNYNYNVYHALVCYKYRPKSATR